MCPLTQRAQWAPPVEDGLLDFAFEGQSSSAGSLSRCSLLDAQEDLQFLNDLGMKFKTLAEICSPPNPSPPTAAPAVATLTRRVADAASTHEQVDPAVRPQGETAGALISSSSTSRSSGSGVGTSPPWMKAVSMGQAAALLPPPQAVLLQQQPVCYPAGAVLQPVQYVVQPQLQNVVLLADEAPGASYPGLFVVQGSKNPPPPPPLQGSASGILIQGSERSKTLRSPASPSSPAVVLPVSPGVAPTSVSLKGWKIVVPNPDGKPGFVSPQGSRQGRIADRDPGSSRGALQRGAILVKKAAAPQGR